MVNSSALVMNIPNRKDKGEMCEQGCIEYILGPQERDEYAELLRRRDEFEQKIARLAQTIEACRRTVDTRPPAFDPRDPSAERRYYAEMDNAKRRRVQAEGEKNSVRSELQGILTRIQELHMLVQAEKRFARFRIEMRVRAAVMHELDELTSKRAEQLLQQTKAFQAAGFSRKEAIGLVQASVRATDIDQIINEILSGLK